MLFRDFARAVERQTGVRPTHGMLKRAREQRILSEPRCVGGWNDYDDRHVDEMAEYLRNHSHAYLRSREATA